MSTECLQNLSFRHSYFRDIHRDLLDFTHSYAVIHDGRSIDGAVNFD